VDDKPEDKPDAPGSWSDRLVASVFAGLIAVWLAAYAVVALRAWLGRV
jgi:hypothetical protein